VGEVRERWLSKGTLLGLIKWEIWYGKKGHVGD